MRLAKLLLEEAEEAAAMADLMDRSVIDASGRPSGGAASAEAVVKEVRSQLKRMKRRRKRIGRKGREEGEGEGEMGDAESWLRRAMENGSMEAALELGKMGVGRLLEGGCREKWAGGKEPVQESIRLLRSVVDGCGADTRWKAAIPPAEPIPLESSGNGFSNRAILKNERIPLEFSGNVNSSGAILQGDRIPMETSGSNVTSGVILQSDRIPRETSGSNVSSDAIPAAERIPPGNTGDPISGEMIPESERIPLGTSGDTTFRSSIPAPERIPQETWETAEDTISSVSMRPSAAIPQGKAALANREPCDTSSSAWEEKIVRWDADQPPDINTKTLAWKGEALFHLGRLLYQGVDGVLPADKKTALNLFAAAASEYKDPAAMFWLGHVGLGAAEDTEQELAQPVISLEELTQGSDTCASGKQYSRAEDDGEDIEKCDQVTAELPKVKPAEIPDRKGAFLLVKEAADAGHSGAQVYLFKFLCSLEDPEDATVTPNGSSDPAEVYRSLGLEEDNTAEMAMRYLGRAVEALEPEALYLQADLLLGTDNPRALALYIGAGSGGVAAAWVNAGAMFYEGLGTDQDFVKAFLAYEKAAIMGSIPAWTNLASMYFNGEGVSQCQTTARRLVQELPLEEGVPDATLDLPTVLKLRAICEESHRQ